MSETELTEEQRLAAALETYLGRRDRTLHPEGHFDNGGRFHLSAEEWRGCCRGIRVPSRAWPWSEMAHARTATHVAYLFDVDETELRRAARARLKAAEEQKRAGEKKELEVSR